MMEEGKLIALILSFFSAVAVTVLGFLLYLLKDKFNNLKEEIKNLWIKTNKNGESVAVMQATALSRAEMDDALKELKEEWKTDFSSLRTKMDENKTYQDKMLTNLLVEITKITSMIKNRGEE